MKLLFHDGPEDGRVEQSSFIDNPNPARTFRRTDGEVVFVNRYKLMATYEEKGEQVGHYEWAGEKCEVLV